jgi:hypothetical protein
MANANGTACVTYTSAKHSQVAVVDAAGRFDTGHKYKATVEDKVNKLSWDVKKVIVANSQVLKIIMWGKGSGPDTTPPDSGDLTITLTDTSSTTPPAPTVNPVPVVYCDDTT